MKHNLITVASGSPYEGRNCPVTKQQITAGTSVVICPMHDSALAEIVFHEQSRCPMCHDEVVLATPAAKPPPTKPAPPRSTHVTNPPQPGYVPPRSQMATTAVVAAVVSLLVIGGIGAVVAFSGLGSFSAPQRDTAALAPQPPQVQVVTAVVTQIVMAEPEPTAAVAAPPSRGATSVQNVAPPPVLPRSAWGARTPGAGMVRQVPVRIVLTHEESSTQCCDGDVAARISANERIHRDKGWADIAWHFIVAPNGRIYEGRDVGYQADSSYVRVNPDYPLDGTIVVGILGNYNLQTPTDASLSAITDLLAWLCQTYDISSSEIYNLRDLAPVHIDPNFGRTSSPGDNMPDSSYFRSAVRSMTGR